ncbi:uncharacterized protein 4921504A21Rikl [Rattus norvegicus]|uniref:uncharacterized protein 4921504A21Rikl n=1 Tax=Rattus norvegicus TaxID=10116 RepID=UPI0003D0E942|nr:uncharacterized protein LOC102547160 [Rattus norvegicus]|eukprot:XP_017448591.1 PREDICTED: uncharacterized protein LOC102547160 [Rattus norvegicus]
MRAEGGGARTGWSAREGFAAVSLPPRLDPVVKARGEAGPGPPRSLREEAGAGKEGSGGPAWAGRREEPGSLGGPVYSFPASRAARLQDARTCSHPSRDKAEIRGPEGKPGAGWPICSASSLLGLHPNARKLEFGVLEWNCRGPGSPAGAGGERLHCWLAPLLQSLRSSQSSQKWPSDRGKLEERVWSSWLQEEGQGDIMHTTPSSFICL